MKAALVATLSALFFSCANADYPLIMWGPKAFKGTNEFAGSISASAALNEFMPIAHKAKFVIVFSKDGMTSDDLRVAAPGMDYFAKNI